MVYVSKHVWHIPLLCVQWKTPDDEQRNCPKHVDFLSRNKFEKLEHLVGFIIRNLSRCTVTCTSDEVRFLENLHILSSRGLNAKQAERKYNNSVSKHFARAAVVKEDKGRKPPDLSDQSTIIQHCRTEQTYNRHRPPCTRTVRIAISFIGDYGEGM